MKLNNLKQLGLGSVMYAMDNNGNYMADGVGTPGVRLAGDQDQITLFGGVQRAPRRQQQANHQPDRVQVGMFPHGISPSIH